MEILTIRIDTRNNMGKYLFGLITEMAKDGTFVKFTKSFTSSETLSYGSFVSK